MEQNLFSLSNKKRGMFSSVRAAAATSKTDFFLNLLESYDSLMGFCEKWLPDSFALDGVTHVSVRDVIARELVVNTFIHREFVSPY